MLASLSFAALWLSGAAPLGSALMRAITVLVIACPCALGLATPLAVTAAMGAASRAGILFRDSQVLETVRNVNAVILDKTGTVTEGSFSLLELSLCSRECLQPVLVPALANASASAPHPAAAANSQLTDLTNSRLDALSLTASLEQYSEHPLGRAFVEFAKSESVPLKDASNIGIHKGSGVTGLVLGHHVFVGNRRLLAEQGIVPSSETEAQAQHWESQGKTVTFFGWDGELRGLAAFGDRLRSEAVALVTRLQRQGISVFLVSGDSKATTQWVANSIAADRYRSEVLPQEKAEFVKSLQDAGSRVAMVGDGINDAPALAQADLGIAMGAGADIAMKAAAVVLMRNSLAQIPEVFDLASRTIRVVHQNLFWAFFYNGIGITLAIAGLLNPILAAGAMLLSSASVVVNSLRLTRQPRTA